MKKLASKIRSNGLDYTLIGDYYIPDLVPPDEKRSLGRWGWLHRRYLKENLPICYNELVLSGRLWTYLADLNEQAEARLELIISRMKKAEGVTAELKAHDPMEWVRHMNSIRDRAEEIILNELVYV